MIRNSHVKFPCQYTSPMSLINYITTKQNTHNTHRPNTSRLFMAKKTQYITRDYTPHLSAKKRINIQKITGSLLYYAREVDPTILMSLNVITTKKIYIKGARYSMPDSVITSDTTQRNNLLSCIGHEYENPL